MHVCIEGHPRARKFRTLIEYNIKYIVEDGENCTKICWGYHKQIQPPRISKYFFKVANRSLEVCSQPRSQRGSAGRESGGSPGVHDYHSWHGVPSEQRHGIGCRGYRPQEWGHTCYDRHNQWGGYGRPRSC